MSGESGKQMDGARKNDRPRGEGARRNEHPGRNGKGQQDGKPAGASPKRGGWANKRSERVGKQDKSGGGHGEVQPQIQGMAVRRAAADILGNIVHKRRTLAAEVEAESGHAGFRVLEAKDKGLVRAILGTALRRRGQISELLEMLLDRAIPEKTGRVEDILHIAIAQVLYLDVADHAAVSLAVEHAGMDRRARPYKGLVNAVLRRLIRERADLLSIQTDRIAPNAPDWMAARWVAAFGEETARAIAAAHMSEPGLDLTLKPDADAARWAERLGACILPTGSLRLTDAGRVEELAGYGEGAWWVQDAAAAMPARLLGDIAGKRVADLCAAPGGKSAQLAAAGAIVTAVDISASRLKRMNENMARLGLSAQTVAADLRHWEPDAPFDAILLDAPCSATGTARRHPDMPWIKRESDIATLAEIQARLLRRAIGWLKPRGLLVYCTCSLEPEEGEGQVAALLQAQANATSGAPRLERVPLEREEVGGMAELVSPHGDLRTLPCHMAAEEPRFAGLDGFYAARLRRIA